MLPDLTLSQEVQVYIDTLNWEDKHNLSEQEIRESERDRKILDAIVSAIIQSRQSFSSLDLHNIDQLVRSNRELVEAAVDDRFTRDAIDAVPGYVTRLMELSRLEASRTPSKVTNTYMREATRAYILGLPQASIALCRAALEQGLKENLGYQESGTFIKFQDLLAEARRYSILDSVTESIAREIATAADSVLHESPADLKVTLDVLTKLSALVQQIYSVEGH